MQIHLEVFCTKFLIGRQTDRKIDKQRRKHNLLDGGKKQKWHSENDTYKAVDVVGVVNDSANLTVRTDGDRSKNIGTSADKSTDLQSQQYNVL